MDLSIIIVNYRSSRLIAACLATVYEQTNTLDVEVIVVDNDSGDDSHDFLTSTFPQLQWVQMGYNAGFARANNEGIRRSLGQAVLLLNPDTLNQDNAIGNCCSELLASEYIACGVQLLNSDGSPQLSGFYNMKGALNVLLTVPYLGKIVKWAGELFRVSKPHVPEAASAVEVDWINGAFLMVKKRAIDNAGLLDEDFFLYAEEAEWCSRLQRQGKLCIFGQYHVIHLEGQSANKAFGSSGKGYASLYDRKGLQIMISNFVRIRKQFGAGWFLLQLLIFSAAVPLFFIFCLVENIFSFKMPFRGFGAGAAYASNMLVVWRFTPRILSGKAYFYKVL